MELNAVLVLLSLYIVKYFTLFLPLSMCYPDEIKPDKLKYTLTVFATVLCCTDRRCKTPDGRLHNHQNPHQVPPRMA